MQAKTAHEIQEHNKLSKSKDQKQESETEDQPQKPEKRYLNEVLNEKLGIRTISALVEVWKDVRKKNKEEQEPFFEDLSLCYNNRRNSDSLFYLFDNIVKQGKLMIMEYKNFYDIEDIINEHHRHVTRTS
jgi:hypothetical protein